MNLETQQQVADNIKYLRHVFGYTQDDIAKIVHLSRSTYAQFELGRKIPTADTLLALSDFYNVSVDTILQIDAKKVINDVVFSDQCKKQLSQLLDAFYHLSDDSRKQLLTKARALIHEEESGAIPSLGHAL